MKRDNFLLCWRDIDGGPHIYENYMIYDLLRGENLKE